jgi:uncharacterized Zn finger protein (UPF0148 family)
MNPYGHDVRMSFCTSCGAPVTAAPGGGAVVCSYCNQRAQVPARDESRDLALAAQQPTMSEAQRFDRLRQQDGKPLLPPPSLQHLFQGGGIPPANVPAAQEEWKRAHAEVHHGGGYPAEERLYHLTMGLHSAHREAQQQEQARALLESALDVLKEPRHRQMFHSMLARAAARSGDIAGAEAWLATCTPYSDDLQTDTAWRFGRAFISTSTGDFPKVLAVLGSRHGDIPIDDSHDGIATIYRANALERTGQHALALEQLVQIASGVGTDIVDQIIALNNHVQLCPETWPQARQKLQAMTQNVLVSKSGFKFGCLFFPLFIGGFALAGAMGLAEEYLDSDLAPFVMGGLVIGYIVLTFVIIGITAGKTSKIKKALRTTGIRGSGQIMSLATTGVRVNNRPQLELTFQVQAPGRDPFVIKHREVMPEIRIPQVQPGNVLPVLFSPDDPTLFVIDWPE